MLPNPAVLSIGELNRRARQILESNFPLLWVCGEVSNLTRAASGHVYFSLKDKNAQVRCVMFRSRAQVLPWRLENGQQVEAQVLVSLYEARGDFQLNVEAMRRAGLGQLFEAFARLKARLEQEGLFEPERKRVLPLYPRRIGIVSSPQAAAVRDVLTTLARRAPHIPVVLYPTLVQGELAGAGIAAAIEIANRRQECDVLIVARGGGSIEDLWAFNEEISARAIADSAIPVVSGVGHETDFTIADFAADLRAATPTAAAELVSVGWFAVRRELAALQDGLQTSVRQQLESRMQKVDLLAHRLISPQQRLQQSEQTVQLLFGRMRHAMHDLLRTRGTQLADRRLSLQRNSPKLAVQHGQVQLLAQRLDNAMQQRLQAQRAGCERLGTALSHLNPDATLARGYSIVRDAAGNIVSSSRQLRAGDRIGLRFGEGSARGHIDCTE
ncbi:MAG: exodeoxyribonuclease VII large subunit [Rhodocyclaceae bacterium]|nr:exodeoxyribonuclease VII large subunit [Rhodocyclaceae bacterium]